MWPDLVSNPGPLIYKSGALPIALCGPAENNIKFQVIHHVIFSKTPALLYFRYFSKYELRELFTLDDPHSSTTQQQLEQMHSGHRLTDPSLDSHIAFLYSLGMDRPWQGSLVQWSALLTLNCRVMGLCQSCDPKSEVSHLR